MKKLLLNKALIKTIPFKAQICDDFKPWLMTSRFKLPRHHYQQQQNNDS